MAEVIESVQFDIQTQLETQEKKSLLRFITCGSVDDGKSTLIGRLLYETNTIYDNELQTLAKDSERYGTTNDNMDFALLVDGLSSEREQGITIDVAYRFFSTPKRKFIVADTPGHEQYTRNMATGASTADLAILMIDASQGVLTQTRRHSYIVSLLGVKQVIVAVNKMDLIDYNQERFMEIELEYRRFAAHLGFKDIDVVPVSALKGDNICTHSQKCSWYKGPTLLKLLETTDAGQKETSSNFRFPVQWVNRPNLNFRGYCGQVASGHIRPGQAVRIHPSGKTSTIKSIVSYDGEQNLAVEGQSTTLTLTDEIDISRGDVITNIEAPCETAQQFQSTLLWMSEKPMMRGRQYILKCATQTSLCIPNAPKYRIDINTMDHKAADSLKLNEIGICDISLNKEITFEKYELNKTLGSFILIDRLSNETVACGWLNFALRRSGNIHKQTTTIDKASRSAIKDHKPCVLWFTGLSGAGKSTIANIVEDKLNKMNVHTILLDGDNVRHGLNKDLGFTERDRAENIRRIAEVSKLMCDAGLISLVSFISPFSHERMMAKELIGEQEFLEIFVDTPLELAEKRDAKGLYKKARSGEIKNFTGIDSPYEEPQNPAFVVKTESLSAEQAADAVLQLLKDKDII